MLGVAAVALTGCGGKSSIEGPCPPRPSARVQPVVQIPSGLELRLQAHEVEALFEQNLGDRARAARVEAYRTAGDLARAYPETGQPAGGEEKVGPMWFVDGWGHFVGDSLRGRTPTSACGHLIILDATGEIYGLGFP